MSDAQKLSPEELAAEQAALVLPKEEELRTDIIAEYGFNEENDAERIDKLVAKELENRKTISTAIKQKIKHRTEADQLRNKPAENPPSPVKKETQEFSPKDYLALSQAGVPADDLDEVMDFAKFKGISIAEALKSTYVKTTLKEKAEERKSAEAAATGAARRPSSKATNEALLEKLERNELPENEIEAAVRARIAQRQNRT